MTSDDEERKRRQMGTPVWPLSHATYDEKFRKPPYVPEVKDEVSVALANSQTPCRDMGFDDIDAISDVALAAVNSHTKITMSPPAKRKVDEAYFEREAVSRSFSCARDHVSDQRAIMELSDDIQCLVMWAFREGQRK